MTSAPADRSNGRRIIIAIVGDDEQTIASGELGFDIGQGGKNFPTFIVSRHQDRHARPRCPLTIRSVRASRQSERRKNLAKKYDHGNTEENRKNNFDKRSNESDQCQCPRRQTAINGGMTATISTAGLSWAV